MNPCQSVKSVPKKGLKRAANNRAEKGLKSASAFANLKIGFCQSRNWHVPTDKTDNI